MVAERSSVRLGDTIEGGGSAACAVEVRAREQELLSVQIHVEYSNFKFGIMASLLAPMC